MNRNTLIATFSLLLIVSSPMVSAQYVEIFSEAEAGNGEAEATFLETVTVGPGNIAYSVLRDSTAADVGVVTAFDGSSFTTIMTATEYQTLGSTSDYAAGNGVGVVGGKLRAISFFDNNVIEVDAVTGTPIEVVSKATLDGVSGVSSNFTAVHETTADGTIYAVESVSDQIIAIAPDNTVSVEINTADFAALLGGTSIGGIGVAGDTILLGSNSTDQLVAWNTVINTGSVVLTEAQIEAATDDVDGNAGFGDILLGGDGLVYFYESDSDYLLSYDPANPAGTLTAVLTEAEFTAGPASDTINQLAWYGGGIAWTDGSIGFYALRVPEPSSIALIGMAGLGLVLVRRRMR